MLGTEYLSYYSTMKYFNLKEAKLPAFLIGLMLSPVQSSLGLISTFVLQIFFQAHPVDDQRKPFLPYVGGIV